MDVQTITWRGIKIEIKVAIPFPSYRKNYGYDMYHIEVSSVEPIKAALPITETGYRSIWLPAAQLDEFGGALTYITEFLEHEANSEQWKQQQESVKQYQLF